MFTKQVEALKGKVEKAEKERDNSKRKQEEMSNQVKELCDKFQSFESDAAKDTAKDTSNNEVPPKWKGLHEGARVEVWWTQERTFYAGTIKEKDTSDPNVHDKFWIDYDDGDKGYVNFSEETFNVL